jgi:protein required for attachment to host cells
MTTTWILSANRSGASLFESNWPGQLMRRIQDIPHPQGRMQNIDTDKPGRIFDSLGQGRHSTSPKQEPTEHLAQQFTQVLAKLLNKGRLAHAYDKLILVAEPKFLGILRAALDKNTESLVIQTVNKDLVDVKEEDFAGYLK